MLIICSADDTQSPGATWICDRPEHDRIALAEQLAPVCDGGRGFSGRSARKSCAGDHEGRHLAPERNHDGPAYGAGSHIGGDGLDELADGEPERFTGRTTLKSIDAHPCSTAGFAQRSEVA